MAKQLSEKEWIELFVSHWKSKGNKILEKIFWNKYEIIKQKEITKETKRWFKNK